MVGYCNKLIQIPEVNCLDIRLALEVANYIVIVLTEIHNIMTFKLHRKESFITNDSVLLNKGLL